MAPGAAPAAARPGEAPPHEERAAEAARILAKYPEHVPVVCGAATGSKLPCDGRQQLLLRRSMLCGELKRVLCRRLKGGVVSEAGYDLFRQEAIYLAVEGRLLAASTLVEEVYERHSAADGFLYVTYGAVAEWRGGIPLPPAPPPPRPQQRPQQHEQSRPPLSMRLWRRSSASQEGAAPSSEGPAKPRARFNSDPQDCGRDATPRAPGSARAASSTPRGAQAGALRWSWRGLLPVGRRRAPSPRGGAAAPVEDAPVATPARRTQGHHCSPEPETAGLAESESPGSKLLASDGLIYLKIQVVAWGCALVLATLTANCQLQPTCTV